MRGRVVYNMAQLTEQEMQVIFEAWLNSFGSQSDNDLAVMLSSLLMFLQRLRAIPVMENEAAELLIDRLKDDLTKLSELLIAISKQRVIEEVTISQAHTTTVRQAFDEIMLTRAIYLSMGDTPDNVN